MFENAEVIHSYTRAQAIEDGVLVDVTEAANRHGFKLNTVMTSAAHATAVAWDRGSWQSEDARLDDVLMLAFIGACTKRGAHEFLFTVGVVPNREGAEEPEEIELRLHIGPGDSGEAVLTIMLPHED